MENTRRWGWFSFIHALANGNALDFERVVELPLKFCLDLKTYEMIQAAKAQQEAEKQRAQIKPRR